MSWTRHLPSNIGSGLLFGIVGPIIGGFIALAMMASALGRPGAVLQAFGSGDFTLMFLIGAIAFGGVPALVTGIAAAILRIYIRRPLMIAFVTAIVGMMATAVFFISVGGVPPSGKVAAATQLILSGGIAGFCCALMRARAKPSIRAV